MFFPIFSVSAFLLSFELHFSASACPALCKCYTEEVIHCNNLGLTALPEDITASATYLNQAGNLLCILSFNYFHLVPSIQTLWLNHNNLTFLYPGTFVALTDLRNLNLSANSRLTYLHAYTFQGLSNLISLDVSHCNIFEIHPLVFSHLVSLEILDVTSNKMRYIPHALSKVPNITRLSLEKNNIEAIGKNSLMFQTSLHTLNLRKNRIWVIQGEAFIHLNELRNLNLGHNNISDLPNQLIEGLIHLKTMYLEANRITAIRCPFSSLINLKKLYLNNNRIVYISRNTFSSLKELEFLHLSRNHLASIPHPLFLRLPKLRHIFLSYNSWNCDCDMGWLAQWNASYRGVLEGLHCSLAASRATKATGFSPNSSQCTLRPDETKDACEETPTNTAQRQRFSAASLVLTCTLVLFCF
ncbi:nyctalopin-like [Ambystoma mexicanum]|uniref:nyctalopin-like n=1 Tax=Ambystoma mexicanum TaxID=8296 RepID=UPI0037E7B20D